VSNKSNGRFKRLLGFLLLLPLIATTGAFAADSEISALDGIYNGIFAAPPAPTCNAKTPLNEHVTWTVATTPGAVEISWKSPFGNTIIFDSPLVRRGEGWDLDGIFSSIDYLGNGRFTG
jgi:hypothetical protein